MTVSFPPPRDPADQASTLRLAALPNAVSTARRHTKRQLEDWGLTEFTDDLLLAVSELVTNSIQAAGHVEAPSSYVELYDQHVGTVLLRLRLTAAGLYAEVWDSEPTLPVATQAAMFDEGGRGLALVAAYCDDWGFYPARTGGKVTWCGIKIPAPPSGQGTSTGEGPPAFWPEPDTGMIRRMLDGLSEIREVLRPDRTDPHGQTPAEVAA